MNKNITPIFGRLKNVTKEEPYVTGTIDIKDDAKNKNQQLINQETDEHLDVHDTEIADRYTKEQVNNLISRTPESNIVVVNVPSGESIPDYLSASIPIDERPNNLFRVPGPGNTTYSEWSWDGNYWIMLDEKDYGIDDKPTAGSDNLVKSGGAALIRALQNNVYGVKPYANKAWNGVTGKLIDYTDYSATDIFVYSKNATLNVTPYKTVAFDENFNFLGEFYGLISSFEGTKYIAFTFYEVVTQNVIYKNYLDAGLLSLRNISSPSILPLESHLRISVLGDSISTYTGVSPDDYNPYYPQGDVNNADYMYWSILAKEVGFVIDTINACGSSTVTAVGGYPTLVARCEDLGTPDVIIVQGGTNDSNRHLPIGELDFNILTNHLDLTVFSQAYDKLIRDIKITYPDAYIITLTNDVMSQGYNDVIKKVSSYHNVFACVNLHYTTFSDGNLHLHPDRLGMKEIARSLYNSFIVGRSSIGIELNNLPQYKKPLTTREDVNNHIVELYLYGDNFDASQIYKLYNVYISGTRYSINISDENDDIICGYDNATILEDSKDGKELRDSILPLYERNDSGIKGFILLNFGYMKMFYNTENIVLNSKFIASLNSNPIISSSKKTDMQFAVSYNNAFLNDVIKELYIYKTDDSAINKNHEYFVTNILTSVNDEDCHIVNISVNDGENNTIILELDSRKGHEYNGIVPLYPKTTLVGTWAGYIIIDWNKITENYTSPMHSLNENRIFSKYSNSSINTYIEVEKLDVKNISNDNSYIRQIIKELYIFRKDGTSIDDSSVFGIGNIYVDGDRRVINIVIRENNEDVYILDADTQRGDDMSHVVIELKEKNNSGYRGYIVMNVDIYSITSTVYTTYSFNNEKILDIKQNPYIYSYLNNSVLGDANIIVEQRKVIDEKISSFVKSTVSDEIRKAKSGTYVDANANGFLPTNTASQNVAAMNALLSDGGVIVVEQPGKYQVNGAMLLHSNTTLIFNTGVIIKRTALGYTFINQAAYNFEQTGYDENIRVIGFTIDTTGIASYGDIFGLRGFLSFFHAKNIYISDVNCCYYRAHGFFMHLCDWDNIEIANVQVYGDKDCIHLGRGKNAYIHNCAISAVDDTIALNAWDFVDSNPETGNIENVKIEDVIELPHYYNITSDYQRTLGFTIRMLNGCWLEWTSGMTVQHSTRVKYNGGLYRVVNLQGESAVSNVAPDSSIDSVNADGIEYMKETSPAVTNCCVKNVWVKNLVSYQDKSSANFCLSNGINEVDHKNYVQGATWRPNENIHFRNCECYGNTPAHFLIQEDLKDVIIAESVFDNTVAGRGLIYFQELFGLDPATFITPTINLVNNLHIIAKNGQFKLSSVNVSGRRDAADVYTTKEQYSEDISSTIKTEDTIITEESYVPIL